MILVIALVMIAFGLSEAIGGNAFLTVYLMGILLGNSNIRGKETLIPFFDGMTGLAQIVLFFLLGFCPSRTSCRRFSLYPWRLPSY